MKYNRRRVEEDAEENRSRGSGGAYIALKDGEKIEGRALPVEDLGDEVESELYVRYGQHYIKSQETYYTCLNELDVSRWLPADWGKKPCEFCKRWAELRGSRDADDQEEAKKFNVSVRFMMNFYVGEEVKIFRMNVKTQPQLATLAFGSDFADVLELKDGRNIVIKRSGEGLGTEYSILPAAKTSTIPRAALKGLHDLYEEIKVLEPKKQREVLKGGEPDESEYVTVRDLIDLAGGTSKPKKKVDEDEGGSAEESGDREPRTTGPKSGIVAKKKAASAPDADDDKDRKPTRVEAKTLTAFGDELGLEIDMDNRHSDVVEAIVESACDGETVTKGLTDDFKAWLEEQGCDVDGKLVKKAAKKKATESKPEAEEEMSDLDRQLAKVRAARKGK